MASNGQQTHTEQTERTVQLEPSVGCLLQAIYYHYSTLLLTVLLLAQAAKVQSESVVVWFVEQKTAAAAAREVEAEITRRNK